MKTSENTVGYLVLHRRDRTELNLYFSSGSKYEISVGNEIWPMRAANGTFEVAFRQNLNLVQVDRIFGTECLAPDPDPEIYNYMI